jgi:DNA-binding SARP family transcriptional activator
VFVDEAAVRQAAVEIGVIGSFDITGGPNPDAVESKGRRPGLAVLGYLAIHRQPVTSQDLARALWPLDMTKQNFGGAAPSTVNNVVSHARKILGRGLEGEELLIGTPDGYRFAAGVTSDWARFQTLAATADREDALARIGAWSSALRLVRGVPFAGNFPGKFFEWVGAERLDDRIKTRVVDVGSCVVRRRIGARGLGHGAVGGGQRAGARSGS